MHEEEGNSDMSGATDAAIEPGDPPPAKARRPRAPSRVRHGIGAAIGEALQAHYDDLIAAPLPDRFLVLLAELEAREKKNSG